MPLSVAERDFALSDDIYRTADAAGTFGVAAAPRISPAKAPSTRSGEKTRICGTFYETAECPFDNRCGYAHNFSELNSFTQNKLLETVSVENIPKHFILLFDTQREGYGAKKNNDNNNNNNVKRCNEVFFHTAVDTAQCAKRGAGGNRRRGKMHKQHDDCGGSVNLCDNSLSSLTSSMESFFGFGSLHDSKNVSPHKGAMSEENVDFLICLPRRCRYPHRATHGTYYDVLGVQRGATQEEIIASYRRWQREYKRVKQVDQQQADARDAIIVEARNVLGHPVLRREYDRTLPSPWEGNFGRNEDPLGGQTVASLENFSGLSNVDISKIATTCTKINGTSMRLAPSMLSGDAISLAQTAIVDKSIW